MDFELTDEGRMLSEGLTRFLDTRYDLTASRDAAKTGAGWQPEVWRNFAEDLGVIGACLPESIGGDGGGPEELMVVTEALGRSLVIEPFIDTVVLGAGLLGRIDHPAAKEVAGKVADGSTLIATAALESSSGGNLARVATRATRDGDDWVLDGSKQVVTTAPLANYLIVSASLGAEGGSQASNSADDFALFLLPLGDQKHDGLVMHEFRTVDDRRAADIEFSGVRVPADALIASGETALAELERSWDDATAAVISEAVGVMRKVFADTVAYTSTRQQFGTTLAAFQALSHRLVDMYIELEQAVAAQYLAILALGSDAAERASAVSAAKATISRAARFIGQNAVQLHGAMGLTEELAVGHYFRRLTVIEYEFGSADQHLDRFEKLARSGD